MSKRIKVEITSDRKFWLNATMVEWKHQYPERELVSEASGHYLVDEAWIADLQRVAAKCFTKVVVAPSDPSRRLLFRRLFAHDEQ